MKSPILLQTKLHPSQVAPGSLNRSRLLRELSPPARSRLVLISAPAGSGKSTLMVDYLSQRNLKAAWLSLGEEDQDPQVFFNYFLEALCLVFPGCAERTRNRWSASGPVCDLASFQDFFISELSQYAQPVAIVLDDYHLVGRQPAINAFLSHLLRAGPDHFSLLLTSRDQPNLPLSWLRSQGLLTEINQEALRFTVPESVELFRDLWKLPLEPELVATAVDKTEGWATGLQLVAQAIRDREPSGIAHYLNDLQGTEAGIYDYLAGEVLAAQPPQVQQFLRFTALPECFNPPLAQELLPDIEASEMLNYLRHSRLFLVEIENSPGWFRYHHLFRDFLRSKLRSEGGGGLTQALHLRIARWLSANAEVVAAIPHYLACADSELAAQMLESVGSELLHKGFSSSLSRWLERLPHALRTGRPGLLVLHSEILDLQGEWTRAVEGYKRALELYRVAGQTQQLASVLEKLSLCYIKYGESKQLLQTCEEGLRLCPEEDIAMGSMLRSWLGATLINSGQDWERGYQLLQSSHALAYQSKDPRAISWACLTYGFVYHFPQGNFDQALAVLDEGIDFFTRLGWPMVLYQLAMNKALVLIVKGEPGPAMALIDQTLLEARRAGHSYVEKGLESLRAQSYLESGDREQCRLVLNKMSRGEIPAQFKPYFYRHRMLLSNFEHNYGQARVDAEEMQRALHLNGWGMYAPECFVSLAFALAQRGELAEAEQRLLENFALCEQARAKFWAMKSHQVMAWIFFLKDSSAEIRAPLQTALRLAAENDYAAYWINDAWKVSGPLLVVAIAYGLELDTAQKLLARLTDSRAGWAEELLQHNHPAIRKAARLHLPDGGRERLRQIAQADPQVEVPQAGQRLSRLQICCLGPLRFRLEGESLEYIGVIRPLALRLLKFFLVQPERVVTLEKLLDTFWPGTDPEKGRRNLATHLSALRRQLKTQALFPRLAEGYRLCQAGQVELDVLEFERCCRQGLERLQAGQADQALALLARAEKLYQGDFLQDDPYEDWADWRRRELRSLFEQSLEAAADQDFAQARPAEALRRYGRLLDCEEPQERIFCKALSCYEQLGDRLGALREYESFRSRLLNAFGIEPQPSTQALMQSLNRPVS